MTIADEIKGIVVRKLVGLLVMVLQRIFGPHQNSAPRTGDGASKSTPPRLPQRFLCPARRVLLIAGTSPYKKGPYYADEGNFATGNLTVK